MRTALGNWSETEDAALSAAVNTFGKEWVAISRAVGSRNRRQCRDRWLFSHVDRRGKWTSREESKLVSLHTRMGNKWAEISRQMPGRTENQVKNHFNSTKRRKRIQPGPLADYLGQTNTEETEVENTGEAVNETRQELYVSYTEAGDSILSLPYDEAALDLTELGQSARQACLVHSPQVQHPDWLLSVCDTIRRVCPVDLRCMWMVWCPSLVHVAVLASAADDTSLAVQFAEHVLRQHLR